MMATLLKTLRVLSEHGSTAGTMRTRRPWYTRFAFTRNDIIKHKHDEMVESTTAQSARTQNHASVSPVKSEEGRTLYTMTDKLSAELWMRAHADDDGE